MRHRLACWRFRVWTKRLAARREEMYAEESRMALAAVDYGTEEWLAAEAALNRALVKRAKWRDRACPDCRSRVVRSLP